jgi:hypothetical protein
MMSHKYKLAHDDYEVIADSPSYEVIRIGDDYFLRPKSEDDANTQYSSSLLTRAQARTYMLSWGRSVEEVAQKTPTRERIPACRDTE